MKNSHFSIDKFTFENYVVDKSNIEAFTVAQEVTILPGKIHNPLYIYGASGNGKSHLALAICNSILKYKTGNRPVYVSADVFCNNYIKHLHKRKVKTPFYQEYCKFNTICIDNVQFFKDKEKSLKALVSFTRKMLNLKKLLIFTSHNSNLKFLKGFNEMIKSKNKCETFVNIKKCDSKMYRRVLQRLKLSEGLNVSDEILKYISNKKEIQNLSQLEGTFYSICVYCTLMKKKLNMKTIKLYLSQTKNIWDNSS